MPPWMARGKGGPFCIACILTAAEVSSLPPFRDGGAHDRVDGYAILAPDRVCAEIIPFRYLPVLLGGKGTSHIGWDTGDCNPTEKKS